MRKSLLMITAVSAILISSLSLAAENNAHFITLSGDISSLGTTVVNLSLQHQETGSAYPHSVSINNPNRQASSIPVTAPTGCTYKATVSPTPNSQAIVNDGTVQIEYSANTNDSVQARYTSENPALPLKFNISGQYDIQITKDGSANNAATH